ncbi:MAG: hypothetical protein JSS82_04580 [Bacteroidetes bacterium]|nr:hypothetical protein [Bacteroidota bacterium]
MKSFILLTAFFNLLAGSPLLAKGAGGHCSSHAGHSSAHCHGTVHAFYAGHGTYHSSEDPFRELYKRTYDGYIVYNGDTLAGNINLVKGVLVLDNNKPGTAFGNYMLGDSLLTGIMLHNDQAFLTMVRFRGSDKHFYRLVHSGRLNLYDDNLSFNYDAKNVNLSEMRVAYDGKVQEMNDFWTTFPKKRLVYFVNTVYGTNLESAKYDKRALLAYIASLN